LQVDPSLGDHASLVDAELPAPGMVLSDRYQLEALIGEGAFSQVFRSTDLKDGGEVALKLLTQDSVDAAGFERFCREADLARKLVNENTVQLLDYDLGAQPVPYIVYELLEGETLDRLLARVGPMSEARAAEIACQVLASLIEAHHAGIVHRDVKPGNVNVSTRDDGRDLVKILDFGIARSTEPAEVALTAAGILIGTPRYMPPEQIRGESPTPGMDIYATGMMLAEMLNGAPIVRCSAAEACLVQLDPEPIAMPEAVLRSKLCPVVLRATEKDARRRYGTADEMLAELEHMLASLSSTEDARAPLSEPPRPSQAPTEVMRAPAASRAPVSVAEPAARPASQAKWVIATVLLLVVAVLATGFMVYAVRTGRIQTDEDGSLRLP